tara:strand:+ start:405 stop:548 length:144 start_codon:yes stop_codon:yes gene_type:complete
MKDYDEDIDETLCAYCGHDRENCTCYTDINSKREPKPEDKYGDTGVQ